MTSEQGADSVRGKRIHFMGIAGIGQSAIARIAHERGAVVSGCDLRTNEQTDALARLGISVCLGHHPGHLAGGVDLLVYTSAIPAESPELARARERGIETVSRLRMLARLMCDGGDRVRQGIGVAGTHGKTTTTWMCANLLIEAGLDPTVMVGGVVESLQGNFREGRGAHFVTEVDESDGLMTEIRPHYAIITNIDHEHLDHYGGIDAICRVFRTYAAHTTGCVVVCADDPRALAVAASAGRPVLTYGLSSQADVRGEGVTLRAFGSTFTARGDAFRYEGLRIRMPGAHNIQNALAVVALARRMGLDEDCLRRSLANCPPVKRRFEVKWVREGVRFIDDYAHHPTEVAATLDAARRGARGRLIAVFQPHRYSRTKLLLDAFARAFRAADHLVVSAIYSANEPPIAGVTGGTLAEAVRAHGPRSVEFIPQRDCLLDHLASYVRPGDTVITMGAGDIGSLSDAFLSRIEAVRQAG